MQNSRQYATITALSIAAIMWFGPSPAIGQGPPVGCWEVTAEGKSINKIEVCQGSKICAKLAAGRIDGKPPNQTDVGKRVFEGATKDGADLWKGSIHVFQFNVDADMVLRVESSTRLDVEGCASAICASRKWNKVNCP